MHALGVDVRLAVRSLFVVGITLRFGFDRMA
jgi:hypothetical protein